jgi:hypothetical protein
MKSVNIEELPTAAPDPSGGPVVTRMFQPEIGQAAEIIPGDADEVSGRLVDIFHKLGVL